MKYILVLKEYLSGSCSLEPSASADATHAASFLARWIRVFTPPRVWVSYQGSNFKKSILVCLVDTNRIGHTFTVSYSPWANGTVESLMRTVLRAMRALVADFTLAPQDWMSVLPLVMTALNEASLTALGSRTDGPVRYPLEVMTVITPARPLHRLFLSATPLRPSFFVDRSRALQLISIDDLQRDLYAMQKEVGGSVSLRLKRVIAAYNQATNIVSPAFAVGYFVLVRRANDRRHKLRFRWFRPCLITDVNRSLVYSVTPLQGGTTDGAHCARLTPHNDSLLGQPLPARLLDFANRVSLTYENFEPIVDIGEVPDGLFVPVQSEGLPDKRDWTW